MTFEQEDPKTVFLNKKWTQILITNVCNLACGGCNQLCGHFPKEKMWFISLEQLKRNIEILLFRCKKWWSRDDYPRLNKFIALYGGEPTLHPEFDRIVELLRTYSDVPFVFFTNGRTFPDKESLPKTGDRRFLDIFEGHTVEYNHNEDQQYRCAHDGNIGYRIDYKSGSTHRRFNPTMVAPIDVIGVEDKAHYWEQAQQTCVIWNACETIVYNDKAYFCTIAGAMDQLFHNGENGWEIKNNVNPFNKTSEEIAEQAKKFCYRCAWCYSHVYGDVADTELKQYMDQPSLISKTNLASLDQPKHKLLQIVDLNTKKPE